MPEPLTSKRTWREDPEGNHVDAGGTTGRVWLQDDDDRSVRAVFKFPNEPGAEYSVGMERVAYVLGDRLGLPMPATWLEPFGGVEGSIQLKIEGRTWMQAEGGVPGLLMDIQNEGLFALAVALDVWIANYDRSGRNIQLQPEPPDKRPAQASHSRFWLIDNGISGLWHPQKFGADAVEKVTVGDGSMEQEADNRLRNYMPERYRQGFTGLADRKPILDQIAGIPDDFVEDTVQEVPDAYLSPAAKTLTIDLLKVRRDQVDKLSADVFPP